MLPITNQDPAPDGTLVVDQPIAFTVDDSVAVASVALSVDDVVVYVDEAARGDYVVTRTAVVGGTRYTILPPDSWGYNTVLRFGVYGEGEPMGNDTASWGLKVEEDPTCFIGPVNAFEESLLFPFSTATLRHTEELRTFLLDNAISRPQANRAVRWLLLRAQDSALAPVLRDLVVTPTTQERSVRLCHQRTNVALDQSLRGKVNILPQVVAELRGVGLPAAHAKLCLSYDRDDPQQRIPLACVLVCLAKALEVNAIS